MKGIREFFSRINSSFNRTSPAALRVLYFMSVLAMTAACIGEDTDSGVFGVFAASLCIASMAALLMQLIMTAVSIVKGTSDDSVSEYDHMLIDPAFSAVQRHDILSAVRLIHNGEDSDALDILNDIRENDNSPPQEGVINFYMSICYNRLGYPTNAGRCAKIAADNEVAMPDSLLMAARSFNMAGSYKDAEECYARLLPTAKKRNMFPFIYNEMGKLYLYLQMPDKASESFRTAIQMGLDPVTAQGGMALAALMSGKEEEACEWYRLALISRIGDVDSYNEYCGQICLSMGYPEDFLRVRLREKYKRDI